MRRAGVALALLAALAVVLTGAPSGRTAPGGIPDPLPELGTADGDMVLMGGAGAAGEAWGYRLLPLDTPAPVAGGQRLAFGPLPAGRDVRQLAFLRRPADGPWSIADVPLDADGNPYRGPAPNAQSARITPKGGGLLVGRDQLRTGDRQLVVLVRDPGGRYRERIPDPAALDTGESVASDNGAGRVAGAAFDSGDRTGAYFGALGPEVEDTVLRFDGTSWTREDVTLPAGVTSARFVALAAASSERAWALLETTTADGRGIELYRRDASGPDPVWAPVSLSGSPFADRADSARGISELGPLTGAADPLTATIDGVWVDGELTVTPAGGDPRTRPFTLYVRSDETLGGSWCDATDGAGARICGHDLGADFDTAIGYRSFAWNGDRFGTRIVTNPRDPGGDAQTNRGTYLRFAGETFERRRGATGNGHASGAFLTADKGFLEGPVEIGAPAPPQHLRRWPVALRAPLTAAVTAPGTRAGDGNAAALAVGADGAVARYTPGQGWAREFLLTSNGSVSRPRLRGVAWPEPGRAVAVGDQGAMWQWRADTGLWERDPATPIGFEGQLMDVAFQPGRDDRGYAVGRAGVLLRYDKTWTQEVLPAELAQADLTSVTFAAGRAMVAAGSDVLVNDGAGWAPDLDLRRLLDEIRRGRPSVRVVRGLADGGAVAAGRGFVAVKDNAGAPWRFTDQPLPNATVVAAAPLRTGPAVRALVAIQPRLDYPVLDDPQIIDPNVPAPVLPAQPLPGDGYVLRETDRGWRDERRTAFAATGVDRPIKSDPVSAFLVDDAGEGWALGGWSGEPDFAGRGTKVAADRARVQTAAVFRLSGGDSPAGPPAATASSPALPAGPVRLAVGGHAECEDPCAALADQQLAPDRLLRAAIDQAARMAGDPNGPRAFLNTGGRLAPKGDRGLGSDDAWRYAELLSSPANLPVFSAVSQSDSAGAAGPLPYETALAGAPAPMGTTGGFGQIGATAIPGAGAGPGARTHYAFDVDGRVRVIVIDNSRGSLADSDPHQNPAEPQLPWLQGVLADAKAKGIATIVVGSRDLSRFAPRLNAASDGDQVAQVLVDGGASAYFYERPEENRSVMIPSGGQAQIPAYGTGTLGYRSPVSVAAGQDVPLSAFGERQFLLAEIDVTKRDPATNRAPVGVRPIPIIDDLSLQATDGTLLRRSRPALFQGLGRRPESGDRWGEPAGAGGPSPPGGDPYAVLPAEPCLAAGCSTRLVPEVQFTSSDPDIADFVKQDPSSTNLRKPLLGADEKVITDNASGLLCPFNAGTTTVTIKAGGIAVSQQITVLAGTAARPCGTRPLSPSRFERPAPQAPAVQQPQLPQIAPSVPATPDIQLPPAPVPAAEPPAPEPERRPERSAPRPVPAAPAPPLPTLLSTPVAALSPPPVAPPPPAGGFARPIPPGGVAVRVFEEKREEEVAPEQSQAFSRYDAHERRIPVGPATIGAVLLLALAGAELRNGPRRRAKRRLAPATVVTRSENPYRRTLR